MDCIFSILYFFFHVLIASSISCLCPQDIVCHLCFYFLNVYSPPPPPWILYMLLGCTMTFDWNGRKICNVLFMKVIVGRCIHLWKLRHTYSLIKGRRSRDRMVVGQQPIQLVPITAKVVSSNLSHVELYSTQHYVIKFISDLRQIGGFLRVLRFLPPIELNATKTEILLKVSLNTTTPNPGCHM